jgi:hypothetical protein
MIDLLVIDHVDGVELRSTRQITNLSYNLLTCVAADAFSQSGGLAAAGETPGPHR